MALITITSARVNTTAGMLAAIVEHVPVGGGTQVVTVDGTQETRTHPAYTVYHVRFVSPDRMVPDELRQVDTYEAACALGEKYAAKLEEHARRVDDLTADLKV